MSSEGDCGTRQWGPNSQLQINRKGSAMNSLILPLTNSVVPSDMCAGTFLRL